MIKLIQLFVIASIFWLIWGFLKRSKEKKPSLEKPAQHTQTVVKCHYCELHVLPHEAVQYHGLFFCSCEHLTCYQKNNQ